MGFLSSSTSVLRLLAPVPPRLDREATARAVTRRAFRELEGSDGVQAAGWIAVHDPLATTLTPADLFFQHYLAVGFRFDRRTVPAKLLFLERRRTEAACRVERGTDRLGAADRRRIKADVEARLLLRALPAPRLFDCVWNLETGRLYFSGRLRTAEQAFVDLFRETFGVAPVPLVPYLAAEHLGLEPRLVEAVRAVDPCSLAFDAPGDTAPPDVPRLPLEEAAG